MASGAGRESMQSAQVTFADRKPLYSTIYKVLGNAIQGGRISEGAVLLEGPLARAFGSSPAPVRKALELLERDGLVRRFDGRGLIVGKGKPHKFDPSILAVEPLKNRPPSWQGILEEVERVVIHQAISGSGRINELGLARFYRIGRTVAHSILTRLESMGVIEKDSSSRWTIVPLDHRRLGNLFEIREHLEPLAFRYAASAAGASQIARYIADHRHALDLYPLLPASELDRLEQQLHIDFVGTAGRKELIDALDRTISVFSLSKHALRAELQLPTVEPFLAEHIAVLELAAEPEGDAAGLLLREHIRSSRDKLLSRLPSIQEAMAPIELPYIGPASPTATLRGWPRLSAFPSTPEGS
jgi:DNA-binding GntR family transcriptional regulator